MADVQEVLSRIAFGLEFVGDNPMRARAFANGARIVKKLGRDVGLAYSSGELAKLKGIGKGLLDVIGAVLEGRPIELLDELEAQIPAGLFEVRRVRGLGPAKVRALWQQLGITTLAELEYACNENRLLELKGFGAKSQEAVHKALLELRGGTRALRIDQAQQAAAALAAALSVVPGVSAVHVAGAVRRGDEVVERIELLVVGAAPAQEAVAAAVDAAGTSVPVQLAWCHEGQSLSVQLLFATGSSEHLAALVARALERGGSLDRARGLVLDGAAVPCAGEDDIYRALGLVPVPPERREADVPLVRAGKATPRLVERADLRGALHNHTVASDGIHTLAEMQQAATRADLEYLGISDHSQSASYAGGLEPERLEGELTAIARVNAGAGGGAFLLAGVESDILRDGELDYDAELLARLDFVVASVHNRFRQDRAEMTARMCRAAADPATDVIGHPTGRLLLGRPPSDFDMDAFLDACAASGCAVELNANPQRLDLDPRALAAAKERGIPISIGADAHAAGALAHLDHGITQARRAGLTPADILNCRPLPDLRSWLIARRQRT